MSSVAVATSLHTLLLNSNVGVEATHGVGSTSSGERTSSVVLFVVVERRTLTLTFTNLGVPHTVRRGIAESLRAVSVDALLGTSTTREGVTEVIGTAHVTFNQRTTVDAFLVGRMPFASSIRLTLRESLDATTLGLATTARSRPNTFGIVTALFFLSSIPAELAVEVASSSILIPAAHLFELLTRNFRVDAVASFNTEVIEDIPHTLGIVDASGLVEVLELTLGLASLSSLIPVTERRRSTSILIFRLFTRVLTEIGGVRPDTLGVEVTVRSVTMLVGAHLFTLILNPGAHRNSFADNAGLESITATVTTITVVIPFTIRIRVTDSFTLVHVEALLRTLLLEVDEAHVIKFTSIGSVSPAVTTAFRFFNRPHATLFSITFFLGEVSDLATSGAGEVSTVPRTRSITEAIIGTKDVGALQRTLLLRLETVDTKLVGLASSLIRVVSTRTFADFSEGVPLTFRVLEASTTSGVATLRADEVTNRFAFSLPVTISHGFTNFTAIEDSTLFEAEIIDRIPHTSVILLTVDTTIPLSLTALDALGLNSLGLVPEAHLITAAKSFSSRTRRLFVGRTRLDTSSSIVIPLTVRIVVTRVFSTNTEITVFADESTRTSIDLPFTDRAGNTSTLRFDEAASTSTEVVGEVPSTEAVHNTRKFRVVDVLTLLGTVVTIHNTHGVGNTSSSGFTFSLGVASARLGTDFRLKIPHAVGVLVTSFNSRVSKTTLLTATHSVVTFRVLGLVEEERPVTTNVSNTRRA